MGAWVKFFKNASPEIGTDQAIESGRASWSRGSLHDIVKVQLSDKSLSVILVVPDTEWYQFDRYHAYIGEEKRPKATRVARVIQAEVQKKHIGRDLLYNNSTYLFEVKINGEDNGYKITERDVGKWITVSIVGSKISWCLAEKGKFNGYKPISR